MKQTFKFLAPVALAAAGLFASQAHAAGQYAPFTEYLGSASYIGIMDPSVKPIQNATIQDSASLPVGAFTDYWVLDIIPTGNTAVSLSFLTLSGTFTSFSVSLYQDQLAVNNVVTPTSSFAYQCASQSQAGGAVACASGSGSLTQVTSVTYTGSLNDGTQGGGGLKTTQFVPAGRYVVQVKGVTAGDAGSASYNGSIQVNQVPEPTTLALAGLALLGSAAAMRKRKSA